MRRFRDAKRLARRTSHILQVFFVRRIGVFFFLFSSFYFLIYSLRFHITFKIHSQTKQQRIEGTKFSQAINDSNNWFNWFSWHCFALLEALDVQDKCNSWSINILNIFISFCLFHLFTSRFLREENTADHTKDMQIDSSLKTWNKNNATHKAKFYSWGQTERIDEFPWYHWYVAKSDYVIHRVNNIC